MKEYLYNAFAIAQQKLIEDEINKYAPSVVPKQKGSAKYNPNNRKRRCGR